MRQTSSLLLLAGGALLAAAPVLRAQEPSPTPAPEAPPAAAAPSAAAPAPTPTPTPRPHEDIIKLWRANLSEDFVKRQIENGTVVYDLTADEVIQCRDAGIPESLIQVMLATKSRKPEHHADHHPEHPAPAPAVTPVAPPAATPVVAPVPPPAPVTKTVEPPGPSFAAEADRAWEGMARRNSGVVLFKSRWDVGILHFKSETLHWIDAKDPGKNLLIPARQIREQFLTCLKKAGGNECFEWGFHTKDDVYRFRDVAWEQGENRKPQEIYDFFKAIYPSLVSSEVPVDKK